MTPQFAMEWSLKQLTDWRNASSRAKTKAANGTHRQIDGLKWVAPEVGCLKVNVDASVMPDASFFAIGMVQRDHTGGFVGGKVMRFEKTVFVFEAETIGIHGALSWIMYTAEGEVCIESDSLLAVQAINRELSYQFEIGHVIDACRLMLLIEEGNKTKINQVL